MILLDELTLRGFLSFGPEAKPTELHALNLLIGPTGSGKSNLIESLALLAATRGDVERVIRRGGGVREWLHKDETAGSVAGARVSARVLLSDVMTSPLLYALEFGATGARFTISEERISAESQFTDQEDALIFGSEAGNILIRADGELRPMRKESVDPTKSILAQRRDPEQHPELTSLGDRFERIQLYREWQGGYTSALRLPQRADLPNDHLLEDGSNLGLVLSRIQADHYAVWKDLRAVLRDLLDGFEDVVIKAEAATLQVFLVDRQGRRFPAVRLSDGTLRFLCLLAILFDPTPAPLVALEEPELGLHPDAIGLLPDLLRDASGRTQLIVTTHASSLVDTFTRTPEVVVVAGRGDAGTTLERLDRASLTEWLDAYGLG